MSIGVWMLVSCTVCVSDDAEGDWDLTEPLGSEVNMI